MSHPSHMNWLGGQPEAYTLQCLAFIPQDSIGTRYGIGPLCRPNPNPKWLAAAFGLHQLLHLVLTNIYKWHRKPPI
jgi:hypothetical protein